MKQILKLVFLLVIGQTAFAQAPSNYTNINGRYRWIAGMFDSTFHIPKGSTPSLRTGGSTNSGGLFYNTSDSSVYTYTGTQWIKLRGSINPSDTTNKYVTQVYKKSGSDSIFYVKGGIHTWAFNDSTGSPGGGGGGKVYYFNGGVSMGTFGGFTMYELGDTANTGAAANFTRSTTGNIANFITDPSKPGLLQIPAGVWSVDAWLSETGGGANHAEIWVEVEKWDGSTITTIATSPIEQITEGATPNLYSWSVSIPTTSLTVTDRIIIQFYISNTNGKTVTLYTQNGYVGEVHTTFTTGIGAINGLTAPAQYLVTGTSGTDFNINSSTATHTFNLPTASATNRGALSTTDWSTFNNKVGGSGTTDFVAKFTSSNTVGTSSIYDSGDSIRIGNSTNNILLDTSNYNVTVRTLNTKRFEINSLGNFSFGTSSPPNYTNYTSLQINGVTGGIMEFVNNSVGTVGRIYNNASAMIMGSFANLPLNFITNNTEKARISNDGLFGIGTSSPDSMLTVANGTWLKRGVRMSALPTGVGTKALRIDANGTLSVADTLANGISGTGTTNYIPKFTSSSAIGNSQIFDNGTSVGIGTSSPSSLLSVGANVVTALNSSELLQLGKTSDAFMTITDGSGRTIFGTTNGIGFVGNYSNTDFTFRTTNAERMRLTSGGSLGLGTTSPNSAGVDIALTINGGTNSILEMNYGGTRGGFLFANSSNVVLSSVQSLPLLFNTGNIERMRLDASGNLGLGTSSPDASFKFTISGNSGAVTPGIYFDDQASSPTDYALYTNGSKNFVLRNMSTSSDIATFTSSGNLGLGVTPSAWARKAIQIGDAAQGYVVSNTRTGFAVNMYYDGNNKYIENNYAALYAQDGTSGQHQWYTAPSGTAGNAISFTQAMTLDASGRLGIGSTSPQQKLHIAGDVQIGESSGGEKLRFVGASNKYNFQLGKQINGDNIFEITPSTAAGGTTFSTPAFVVTYDSKIGIGTTSPTPVTSGALVLQVNSNASNNAEVKLTNASTSSGLLLAEYGNDGYLSNIANGFLLFGTNNTERMRITSGGNVGIGNSNPAYKLSVNGGISANNDVTASTGALGVLLGTASTALGSSDLSFIISDNGAYGTYNDLIISPRNNGAGNQGNFRVYTSGSERMRITDGGNVGIGTTSPAFKLHVQGADIGGVFDGTSTSGSGFVSSYNSADGNAMQMRSYGNATGATIFGNSSNKMNTIWSNGDALYALGTIGATPMIFGTSNSERMRITSGGLVGIGISSPNANDLLSVVGNSSLINTSYKSSPRAAGYMYWRSGGDATERNVAVASIAGWDEYNGGQFNGSLKFYTQTSNSLTEKMQLTSSGELLINTTSDAGDYKLQVNGNAYYVGQIGVGTTINSWAGGFYVNQYQGGFVGSQSANYLYSGQNAYFNGTNWKYITTNPATLFEQAYGAYYFNYAASGTAGNNITWNTGLTLNNSGNAEFGGSIKTAAPSGGTAAAWKLGERVASAGVTFNDQQYIQLDIGGTLYYLATVDLPMPEAYPQATSGPSNNYKITPVQVKTTKDAEIEKLRKEIEELKQLIKNK